MIDPKRFQTAAEGPQILTDLSALGSSDKAVLMRLVTDFRYFAARCLWIITKGGDLVRFKFNDAQEYYHIAVEDMLAKVGYVRMIVLKGRQQGLSTYIVARGYWIALTRSFKSVCILAHDDKTTGLLFKKVEIFKDYTQEPLKPQTEEDNKYALRFQNRSNFYILTAGSGQAGRGSTAQFRHESERAFYKKKEDIDSGVGQNVGDFPGTEVHRETTANGFNYFQKEYTQAKAGLGQYWARFIPWYWQREYRTPVRGNFVRTPHEQKLVRIYGLCDEQLQWRRDKILELEDIKIFRREYPLNDTEAFQASGETHFDGDEVMAARRSKVIGKGPVIIGCDPAGSGDRTVIAIRRGRQFIRIIVFKTMTDPRLIGILANLIDEYDAVKCFIDYGYGHGVIQHLRENGYKKIVKGIHFAGTPYNTDLYADKRTEMLFDLRKWFRGAEVSIPDNNEDTGDMIGDDISQDLAAIPEADASSGVFRFPPKKKIKKDFGRSPDICDAMMLTFAEPIRESDIVGTGIERQAARKTAGTVNGSGIRSFSTYRKRVGNKQRWRQAA